MILSSSSSVQVVTTTAATLDVVASYADDSGTAITEDTQRTAITTATTTTIVSSPGSGKRIVRQVTITNKGSTIATDLSVVEDAGGTDYTVVSGVTLYEGESLVYSASGWQRIRGGVAVGHDARAVSGHALPLLKIGTAAEAAAQWYCYGKDAGMPGIWSPGTPGLAGRVTDGTASGDAGCVPISNASGGLANYVEQYTCSASVASTYMLIDVLWVNTGTVVTTTTAQTVNSVAFPARDIDGTTNGRGVMLGLLVTGATGNGGVVTTITASYTDSNGNAGNTATIPSFPATAVIGTIVWFALAAGDEGVQSVQTLTLGTTLTSGTVSMIAATWLPQVPVTVANTSGTMVPVSPYGRPAAGHRLYDGACLLLTHFASATTAQNPQGTILIGTR